MQNPFKINSFRKSDLEQIKISVLNNNRLVLVNSVRSGCSALALKALEQLDRPYICINLQQVVSVSELAALLLSGVLSLYPFEKISNLLSEFKVGPTISFATNSAAEVSFPPNSNGIELLDNVFCLIEKVSSNDRLTIVFDEFHEIVDLEKILATNLSKIIQTVTHTNFIFLGTKENSLISIFENPRSVFYRFGVVERLAKIPPEELLSYVSGGLKPIFQEESVSIAEQILAASSYRPFYAQQLATAVWDLGKRTRVLDLAMSSVVAQHDLDYQRVWSFLNRTDRLVMKLLAAGQILTANSEFRTSTLYSSAAKLAKKGFLAQSPRLEIEDPFFKKWVLSLDSVSVSKP